MNLVKLRCEACGAICNFDVDSGKKGVICKNCKGRIYYAPENIVSDEPQMQEAPMQAEMEAPQMEYEPQPQEQPMYEQYEEPNMGMQAPPMQNMQPQMQQMPPQMMQQEMPPTVDPRARKRGKRGQQTQMPMEQPMMQEQMPIPNKKNRSNVPDAMPKKAPSNSGSGTSPILLVLVVIAVLLSAFSAFTSLKTSKAVNEMKDNISTTLMEMKQAPAPAQPTDMGTQQAPTGDTSGAYDTFDSTGFGNSDQFGTPAQPAVENNTVDPNTQPAGDVPTLDGGTDANGNLLTDENAAPAETAPSEEPSEELSDEEPKG